MEAKGKGGRGAQADPTPYFSTFVCVFAFVGQGMEAGGGASTSVRPGSDFDMAVFRLRLKTEVGKVGVGKPSTRVEVEDFDSCTKGGDQTFSGSQKVL